MDAGDAEGRCAGGAALPAAGPELGWTGTAWEQPCHILPWREAPRAFT